MYLTFPVPPTPYKYIRMFRARAIERIVTEKNVVDRRRRRRRRRRDQRTRTISARRGTPMPPNGHEVRTAARL
jgi:hypothetical protein